MSQSKRNVVLIVLDTVRKDTFDEYAPRRSNLADVEFDRCYAPSSWSVPSHASMLAGELPHRHGVHSYDADYADLDRTFLDDLDHRTLGVSANGAVSEAFGFDAHFDEFTAFAGGDERSPDALSFKHVEGTAGPARYVEYLRMAAERGQLTESLLNGLYVKANDFLDGRPLPNVGDGGAAAVAAKSRSMTADCDDPYVLFTNFIDAHSPLTNLRVLDSDVPYRWSSSDLTVGEARDADRNEIGDYLDNYRQLYAANVEYLDRTVSSLIEDLRARTGRETVAVVTADHGEELRYPGERDLGHTDFGTPLLHVPLLVIGASGSNRRVSGLTSLLDVGKIVTALARGEELPDLVRDRVPAERIGMLFYGGDDEYWTRGVRTVYEDDHRYEWDTLGTADRVEVSVSEDGDREAAGPPERVLSEFGRDLDEYVTAAQDTESKPDLASETERQLEDLGYKV